MKIRYRGQEPTFHQHRWTQLLHFYASRCLDCGKILDEATRLLRSRVWR